MDKVETAEDLYNYAVKAKEMFPEIKGVGDPMYYPLTRYFAEDPLILCIAKDELVAYNETTKKAVSYFETQAFQDLCKFNGTLAAAGLFSDEETLNYENRDGRMDSGNYLWQEGSLGKDAERINSLRGNVPDAKLATYLLAPEKHKFITSAGGEALFVPNTAANPAGAVKFLNWLYSDVSHYRLAIFGVEGKDYVIENGRIAPVGDTLPELFYEWMFDNTNYKVFSKDVSQDYVDTYLTWDKDAVNSALLGFTFNNENVKEVEVRLQEAMTDFRPLMTGFVDFDDTYPGFIQKLKDAGIDEYVAEVQRQIDAYIGK